MPSATKVQRWVDLIAALLYRHGDVPFVDIARRVPAYLADGSVEAGRPSDAVKRMFERDKKELRALGVPLDSISSNGDPDGAYRLRTRDFYLPYLTTVTPRGATKPRKPDQYGYHALSSLTLEPDELVAVEEAARRARQLGDPSLAADAESAMRKLAFDLPIDPESHPATEHLVPPRRRANPEILATLGDALVRRKRIAFTYDSMNSRSTTARTVEPYGLFFLNGHWYLAARTADDGDIIKNFRVSRMHDVAVNTKKDSTPDYEIPRTFDLREHGRSRHAWELGDGDTTDVIVEFRGSSGAAAAGAQLGSAIEGEPDRRVFRVRRVDAFSRWLLSFAGEAIPVSPPELVETFADQVRASRALYARDDAMAAEAAE